MLLPRVALHVMLLHYPQVSVDEGRGAERCCTTNYSTNSDSEPPKPGPSAPSAGRKRGANKLVEEVTDHLPARTSQADMTRRLEELEQRVIEQGATLDRLNGELAALLEQLTPRQQSPHP
jgi:hypothetical protein